MRVVLICESLKISKVKRALLMKALELTDGNRRQAAALLGISVRSIQTWMSEIEREVDDVSKQDQSDHSAGRG